MFAPPKLTDEDFSPFASRGGLFSGGQGLFDDEDDEVSRRDSAVLPTPGCGMCPLPEMGFVAFNGGDDFVWESLHSVLRH